MQNWIERAAELVRRGDLTALRGATRIMIAASDWYATDREAAEACAALMHNWNQAVSALPPPVRDTFWRETLHHIGPRLDLGALRPPKHDPLWAAHVNDLIERGDPESLSRAGRYLLLGEQPTGGPTSREEYRGAVRAWLQVYREMPRGSQRLVDQAVRVFLKADAPVVRPSIPPKISGPITDEEVADFMARLETDGLRVITTRGEALMTIDHVPVHVGDVIGLYRPKPSFERAWSGSAVKWERALLEDTLLLWAAARGPLSSQMKNTLARRLAPLTPPFPGGIEKAALTLAKRLTRNGHLVRASRSSWAITPTTGVLITEQLKPRWVRAAKDQTPRETS